MNNVYSRLVLAKILFNTEAQSGWPQSGDAWLMLPPLH